MSENEINFRDLLQYIEAVLYGEANVDPAAFLQALQPAKPAFLNLLRYKARSPGCWAAQRPRHVPSTVAAL